MSLNFLKSLLITTIITLTVVPIFLLIAPDNTKWVAKATLIWSIDTILVFYPSMRYLYPHLISKMGVYLLSTILTTILIWLNIILIQLLLPYEYIYYALFSATATNIAFIGAIYLTVNVTILNFILLSNIEFYEEERLF